MNHIDEIFLRADIQRLRGFLQDGTDCVPDPRSAFERLNQAEKHLLEWARQQFSEQPFLEDALDHILTYAGTVEDVYLETGLQAGALLTARTCGVLLDALARSGGTF